LFIKSIKINKTQSPSQSISNTDDQLDESDVDRNEVPAFAQKRTRPGVATLDNSLN